MNRRTEMANVLILAMFFCLASLAAYVPITEAQVAYSITGSVKDASTNTGLQGVVVTVKDAGNNPSQATTDASGNFTVINLAAGDYTLTDVTKAGYEWISAPPLPVTLTAEAPTAAIETIYMRPATGPEPYVISLASGWNLVSLPNQPAVMHHHGQGLCPLHNHIAEGYGSRRNDVLVSFSTR